MLVYVDESGFPDPRSPTLKSVLAAVCISESRHRKLSRELYKIKKGFFSNPQRELKATQLIRSHVFENRASERELIERIFELVAGTELAVFAAIMERSSRIPSLLEGYLPVQYRFLLQRINQYMVEIVDDPSDMAILVFDGSGTAGIKGGLGQGISNYLFRTREGQSFARILSTPFFVDSKITPGIQIADMMAGCIRHCKEKNLPSNDATTDPFTSALMRYFRIIESKTYKFETDDRILYGLFTIQERYLYQIQDDDRDIVLEDTPD